jgi:hypothetical protein
MRSLAGVGCSVALSALLLAGSTAIAPTASPTAEPRGREARLVAKACADTTYARCAESVTTALDVFAGSLVAVCEYGNGTGDVVLIEKRREAKATCSGDGAIAPSRVVTVIRLPMRGAAP